MTEPDIDVHTDLDADRDVPLTTDPDQQTDEELDPNTGEGGSG